MTGFEMILLILSSVVAIAFIGMLPYLLMLMFKFLVRAHKGMECDASQYRVGYGRQHKSHPNFSPG